jgi:hypothetical protein
MPAKEIKELRQSGQLEKALNLALSEYQQDPDNIWTKRNLSWVYYDYVKSNCLSAQFESFCKNLKSVSELQLPADEKLLFDNTGWLVVKLGFALLRENDIDFEKFNTLFDLIKEFHFTKPSEVYSSLFKVFHRAYKDTDKYLAFADWWNFENFRREDYNNETLPNGKTIMALAEQAYIAYTKQLLPKQIMHGMTVFDKEKAFDFLPKLDIIEELHPEYQYPPYFKAKLLLALGSHDNILSSFLPFAKKKRNDFWVWEVMSETFTNDEEKVFACYCRGLSCSASEEMIVKLREKIIPFFIRKEMWDEAKTEIVKIQQTRTENNWKVSNNINQWVNQSWFANAKKKNNNHEVYKQYIPITDELLFSDVPEELIIVEFVNSDKKMLNFITSDKKMGFFKYDRFLKSVKIGDTLNVRFLKKNNSGLCSVATITLYDAPNLKQQFIKEFEGTIKFSENNSFGFVDNIFVSPTLISKSKLANNLFVFGKAIKSYNKKRGEWGWQAITCFPNH